MRLSVGRPTSLPLSERSKGPGRTNPFYKTDTTTQPRRSGNDWPTDCSVVGTQKFIRLSALGVVMSNMRRFVEASTACCLVVSCGAGELGIRGEAIVAKLTLHASGQGLESRECLQRYGKAGCSPYPNPLECTEVQVYVRRDGATKGSCQIATQVQAIEGLRSGIPFSCRAGADDLTCWDIYANPVLTLREDELSVFPSAAPLPSPEQQERRHGSLHDQNPEARPPGVGNSGCAERAALQFSRGINQLLEAEGLAFRFSPDTSSLRAEPTSREALRRKLTTLGSVCGTTSHKTRAQRLIDHACDPAAEAQGRCYCHDDPTKGATCRCARITAVPLRDVCEGLPSDCDADTWAFGVFEANRQATAWLNGGYRITQLTADPGVAAGRGIASVVPDLTNAAMPEEIVCQGSPLVLDLHGDGISLSSAAQGVSFDLSGAGFATRTAWVAGKDDVLLALDRNGNGQIDDGTELFGEGTPLRDGLAPDGFAALASLDSPARGGNRDGLVDATDPDYRRLLLWNDADHDGVSKTSELQPITQAGIVSLSTRGRRYSGYTDRHGNDTSLRSTYRFISGKGGLIVDVYFVNR